MVGTHNGGFQVWEGVLFLPVVAARLMRLLRARPKFTVVFSLLDALNLFLAFTFR